MPPPCRTSETRKSEPNADEEDRMKNRVALSLTMLLLVVFAAPAQQSPPTGAGPVASNRTDLYHVHFVKAAPGKSVELLNSLKNPAADTAMPTHALILRHLEGDDWDFAVIQHLGNKVTLDTSGAAFGPARELRAWHNDTYAQGPAWSEFAKAMGIGQQAAGAAPAGSDLYIATTYRGAAGHRAQLEDPEAGARARRAGLTQDAGLELRQHMASHTDTIAERVAIQAAK